MANVAVNKKLDVVKKNYSNSSLLIQQSIKASLFDIFLKKMASLHDSLPITLKSRVKRAGGDGTLVEATINGDYTYWLSQEDIADIARLVYDNYRGSVGNNAEFEILGAISHLGVQIEAFQLKTKHLASARLTLIINLEQSHWVTLVVSYKQGNYVGYYVDSKNNPIPSEYYHLLLDQFQIQPISLSPGFPQQSDDYNCGLWVFENATDLNRMLDENQALYWVMEQLKRPRSKEYFCERRQFFTEKIRVDPIWRGRYSLFLQDVKQENPLVPSPSIISSINSDSSGHDSKRFKIQHKDEEITILLEIFVEAFMSAFMKRLGPYHLLAKGERLTEEALKIELKTGLTGALLGAGIAQSIVGSIPSLVASLRVISGKYYFSKGKAQRITRIFSNVSKGELSSILSETAVNIFHSFESQFMLITDKAGDSIAMEKLAEDAVGRVFNYIEKYSYSDDKSLISRELLEQGVLQGPSEKFFDPSVKQARLRISGNILQDKNGNNINTSNLYEKTGLVVLDINDQPDRFYSVKGRLHSNRYGYRRLLDWEKEANGKLKEIFEIQYVEEYFPQEESIFQFSSRKYNYALKAGVRQAEAKRILDKIENRYPPQIAREYPSKNPILFGLRKPIENFTGRTAVLEELHNKLLLGRTAAVIVPALSALSIYSDSELSFSSSDSSQVSSGSQLSISGLGGIGKTQLALRYAELYARDYDYNVLWINAETQENLAYSFYKLASKLKLETKDCYGQKKNSEEIVEEVYEYFSDRKSLFIFDNVENYRAIEVYLPKSMIGNKPTLLITSRYINWRNVASILSLSVFTEQETEEFIKKSFNLQDDSHQERIKELNQLLQGLPLALQQAITYIKLRKNTDSRFFIHDYMELYKEKNKELLSFDFSNYSNDPYMKTVFTTWLITLDKIKTHPMGQNAIEILNIMAYLDPENISSKNFFYLKHINYRLKDYHTEGILHLLKSYSMINSGHQENKYTLHRLVQQVIRINLESDQDKFEEIVKKTQQLLFHYNFKDEEDNFHYLHFLLYMSEHMELKNVLLSNDTEKILFDKLAYQNVKYWFYFIDLAYLKFPKEKYLKFLGDALAYCTKSALFLFLSETLNYIEKKWQLGIFSKENIKYIVEHTYNLRSSAYTLTRLSGIPARKQQQKDAIRLIYDFKIKMFGEGLTLYDTCPSHSLKRSVCSFSAAEQDRLKSIREENVKSSFKKVGLLSFYMNSGLTLKNFFADTLNENFSGVAASFGLVTSSAVLGKISNSLLVQGENLAADAISLEKDLGLEGKSALHILFNEEVLSIEKRQFLGKAIQVASPFIARGTSIFFAYNLKNEIQAYRTGDKAMLPDIISNGIIVGVDGIEAGIEGVEFLEIITGVSEFTGPVGEAVAVLAWLGADGYTAEQQVEGMEKYVHLSGTEKFIQGLRAFFHMAPSEYLAIKINNARLVEDAIAFLKQHTDIKQYIFPSFYSETVLHENNRIFLDKKRDLILDCSSPDEPKEGHVFCLSGMPKNKVESVHAKEWGSSPPFLAGWPSPYLNNQTSKSSYLCYHALGIEYPLNRTGNATLVSLGQGDDEVIAAPRSPTLFIVEQGKKLYKGSDAGNVFILTGDATGKLKGDPKGKLEGGDGTDIVTLDNFYPEKSDYLLIDSHGFLCGKNSSTVYSVPLFCPPDSRMELKKINQIYGRQNQQDIIYPNQAIGFIDGYGGKNKEYPDSFFITDRAYKSQKFVLRNNTLILFPQNTTITAADYRVPAEEVGEAHIQFHFIEATQHRFFFECSLQDIDVITIRNNTLSFVVLASAERHREKFSIIISDPSSVSKESNQTKRAINTSKSISYFIEAFEIKILSNDQLYAQEMVANNKTLDDIIPLFRNLTIRLDKSFSIQLINNVTLSIGRGKHEIFYINGSWKSHVVGNGGENAYIIGPGNNTAFPLPEVTLYDTQENLSHLIELRDTLDLREIIKKYKQICPNAVITPHLSPVANDLILILSTYTYSLSNRCINLDSSWTLATIRLKDALLDNWYQKLDIFLEDAISKHIIFSEDEVWTLMAAPVVFADDKKIIMITDKDIGEKAEILILKNIGNYRFFHNGADLILTNILTPSADYCTLICYQFYQMSGMKEKILSATFSFFDQEIHLKDHLEKINHAANFSDIAPTEMTSTTVSTFLNSTSEKTANFPQVRLRRQVNAKELMLEASTETALPNKKLNPSEPTFFPQTYYSQLQTFGEEDRISAIADDYLKRYKRSYPKNKYSFDKENTNQKKFNRKTSSQTPVQKKSSSIVEEKQPFYSKNNANPPIKRNDASASTQNKQKSLAKAQKENFLRTPSFSKPKMINQKNRIFKD